MHFFNSKQVYPSEHGTTQKTLTLKKSNKGPHSAFTIASVHSPKSTDLTQHGFGLWRDYKTTLHISGQNCITFFVYVIHFQELKTVVTLISSYTEEIKIPSLSSDENVYAAVSNLNMEHGHRMSSPEIAAERTFSDLHHNVFTNPRSIRKTCCPQHFANTTNSLKSRRLSISCYLSIMLRKNTISFSNLI